MTVLSIIACRIFEDELAHVLSSDRELEQLIVVEGRIVSGCSENSSLITACPEQRPWTEFLFSWKTGTALAS